MLFLGIRKKYFPEIPTLITSRTSSSLRIFVPKTTVFSIRKEDLIIRGRWDRVDEQDGNIYIVDFKSSEVKDQKKADKKAKESLQLAIYAWSWLAKEKKYKVLLLGGEAEKKRAENILAALDCPVVSLVGQLGLAELVAVISTLDFYIGMDTGPSHIAAALNIPMVMLFLNPKAQPARWGPYKVRSSTVESTTDMPAEKVIAACEHVISG